MKTKITILICTLCLTCNYLVGQSLSYPVIDSHFHVKTLPEDESLPEEELFSTMEEYFEENKSIDLRYVFGLSVAQKGDMEKTRMQNNSLFSMAERNSKLIPVCSVHPNDGEAAITELNRIKEMGGKIIKLHPHSQNLKIISDDVIDLVRAAGELGLVVLTDGYGFIATNYFDNLVQLTMLCPDTKFIIAHMGGAEFHKIGGYKMVGTVMSGFTDNIWYDISATVNIYAGSPYQAQLEWVMKNVGTDRILFGTDNPVATLSEALEAFYKLDFTDSEREQILYKNAKDLLQLK